MKVAIVHDELLRRGGAERVVISIHRLYPNATIYTAAYNPEKTYPYFKKCKIKTSFLNAIVKNEKHLMLLFFPFGILAFRLFKLDKYDLVILSSAHGAQYVRKPKKAICINYAHYVFRFIWEPESYSIFSNWIVNMLKNPTLSILRFLDKKITIRADVTLFNSSKTMTKYRSVFEHCDNFEIIYPPVDLDKFKISDLSKEYFLVVSRLENYKRVDLPIDTFKELKDEKLIIVGKGTQESSLRSLAADSKNISFRNEVSNEELIELYSNCKALIFPQIEDFGITPLEANASGRPTIAFKKGGVLETMIENKTTIFFEDQSKDSLKKAIDKFYLTDFSTEEIRENAKNFEEARFHDKLRKVVSECLYSKEVE